VDVRLLHLNKPVSQSAYEIISLTEQCQCQSNIYIAPIIEGRI